MSVFNFDGMPVHSTTEGGGIVLSYQGAFGPPTLGHYMAMRNFAFAMIKYAKENNMDKLQIVMLFMPTAASSSKPHLGVTKGSRLAVLEIFCKFLSKEFEQYYQNIRFIASDIEYRLSDIKSDTSTWRTIGVLNGGFAEYSEEVTPSELSDISIMYSGFKVFLGMGKDNATQFPFWVKGNAYVQNLAGIAVADREASAEDMKKLREFIVPGGTLNFEILAPWDITKPDVLQMVQAGFGIPDSAMQQKLENKVLKKNTSLDEIIPKPYEYRLPLPTLIFVNEALLGSNFTNVPPTSSTELRKMICLYITTGNKNLIADILNLMFNNRYINKQDIGNIIDALNITIIDYFDKNHCGKDLTAPAVIERKDMETLGLFNGGKRTKKRKNKKTKKTKKTKKNRKTNKRSK